MPNSITLEQRELIYEEISSLRKDINDIKETVHSLAKTKQNKVPLSVVITVLGSFLVSAAGIVWKASEVTTELRTLQQTVIKAGEDRFYGKDGDQLEKRLMLELAIVQNDNAKLESRVERLKENIKSNETHIDDVRLTQIGCKKDLENVKDFTKLLQNSTTINHIGGGQGKNHGKD